MRRIMLDIESLSLKPNAFVLSIGAVEFDVGTASLGREFKVTLHDGWQETRHKDYDTFTWWVNQALTNPRAGHVFQDAGRVDADEAMDRLTDFVKGADEVWANGPQFDCVVLENLADELSINRLWKYSSVRDLRTILNVAAQLHIDPDFYIAQKEFVAHSALDDAKKQAWRAIAVLRALGVAA